jgi:hypothetical protein
MTSRNGASGKINQFDPSCNSYNVIRRDKGVMGHGMVVCLRQTEKGDLKNRLFAY